MFMLDIRAEPDPNSKYILYASMKNYYVADGDEAEISELNSNATKWKYFALEMQETGQQLDTQSMKNSPSINLFLLVTQASIYRTISGGEN